MQTNLTPSVQQTPQGQEADAILRTCVHCGFCTATCPTYQLLGNELDSPRGRIYLIKAFLEGNPVTEETQHHLDLCLTCRACEAACPSGVKYGRLIDIGRDLLEQAVARPLSERLKRWGIRQVLPNSILFNPLLQIGQTLRPLLPQSLKNHIPPKIAFTPYTPTAHARIMLVLDGCVQPALAPKTNADAMKVLDKLGIRLISAPQAGCCGAVDYHLAAHEEGLTRMRQNIDAWWTFVEQGAEAIVMTASGCGNMVKEYGYYLKDDPQYASKAARISAICRDLTEVILQEGLDKLKPAPDLPPSPEMVAVHVPCSLQHAQRQPFILPNLLKKLGFKLTIVPDGHLCCGSAGTYSLFNKAVANQLLDNKINALQSGQPSVIVTANIGCQAHLQSKSQVPVKHWIELVAERL
ncbi:glycolate oxidase subunit GlcF [Beggiatoa leptomitoformis]|uniref:Glycolate oxidase iron-sulfur subunit n=1 Tax=Beggiatoa leptomitoformis TaxID=288004 RepID=A0A2N9YA60_9GAMM|nr:glycolate oxidase subunit GlcF [Beggiatoa leptomitoformis]ALG67230.1 glycolate oxidase subunit GlcF [Beggiatoa leptomitoformis]AUI67356.1 glycolate oxidase subunit GlcF [Beggiatoa leptomitoformis]